MKRKAKKSGGTIRSFSGLRYAGWTFLAVGVFCFLICIPYFKAVLASKLLALVLPAVCAALGGLALFRGYALSVEADAQGLRWRDRLGNHTARWDEVSDYYALLPETSAGRSYYMTGAEVVTRHGEKLRVERDFTNAEALNQKILENATNVSAPLWFDGQRHWFPLGARPSDLPATFSYDEEALRSEARRAGLTTVFASLIGSLPLAFACWLIGYTASVRSPWAWFVFGILTLASVVMVTPSLRSWYQSGKARKDARERLARGERFEATVDGLTCYVDRERRFTPWDAIVGYDFVLPRFDSPYLSPAPVCRIRTADNKEFTLTNRIGRFPLLQHILRTYATSAVEAQMESNARQALGGVAARWTGGEEGHGDRVYHSRTRSNRNSALSLGLAGGSLFLAACAKLWGAFSGKGFTTDLVSPVLMGLVFAPLAVYTTVKYWTGRIILGEQGLTVRLGWKERFVPWSRIRNARTSGQFLILEVADEKDVTIEPHSYAYGSEIAERIADYRRPFLPRVTQADVPDTLPAKSTPITPATETPTVYQMVGEQR